MDFAILRQTLIFQNEQEIHMSDDLAQLAEDFFMDKLKDALNENEKRQIKNKYNVTGDISINTPLDQAMLDNGKNNETVTTITKQFFDEFGDSDKAHALGVKIIGTLTSQLNSDISNWPETKKFFRRLGQTPALPLDDWNNYVGLLVKYSKSFLSTFVQEWYHAVLIPRLKARAMKARFLMIGAVGLVIMFFIFLSQK